MTRSVSLSALEPAQADHPAISLYNERLIQYAARKASKLTREASC